MLVHLYANILPHSSVQFYLNTVILPGLCLRSSDNEERPRMLLDGRLAFYQILPTQLSDIWNHSFRLFERVLLFSDVTRAMDTRSRLTTADKSSEYISCTSTELTSNPSNRRSTSKSEEGCRLRMLSRILFLSAVIIATVSMYAGFRSAFWIHSGYVGPTLRLQHGSLNYQGELTIDREYWGG